MNNESIVTPHTSLKNCFRSEVTAAPVDEIGERQQRMTAAYSKYAAGKEEAVDRRDRRRGEQLQSILVTVSGPDQVGVTAQLMEIIVKSHYEILDMGQSVTHGLLSLSILIYNQAQTEKEDPPILKDLLFAAKKMGMNLDFEIVDVATMPTICGDQFILSCVDKTSISSTFLRDMSQILSRFNINILRIDNMDTGQNFRSVEITTVIPPHLDLKEVKSQLLQMGHLHQTDMALLKEHVYRRSKRLIVFDMDSTLIQTEIINEMAQAHGVADEVSQITAAAMDGKLDFTQALLKRVSLLQGLPVQKMGDILQTLPLTPGAQEFITTVKDLGYKVALISGGFDFFAQALKQQLGLDYAFANKLEIQDGKLTGRVTGNIVHAEHKAMLLERITKQEKIKLDQVVAIGDGANDLPMLDKAGLGIAFHAKDAVKKQADHHLSFGPMTTILSFLGIPEQDRIKP